MTRKDCGFSDVSGLCEPEAERESDKQSYEIAGGRRSSKLLLFGTNVLYFQHKSNYVDVDNSGSFHISWTNMLLSR